MSFVWVYGRYLKTYTSSHQMNRIFGSKSPVYEFLRSISLKKSKNSKKPGVWTDFDQKITKLGPYFLVIPPQIL